MRKPARIILPVCLLLSSVIISCSQPENTSTMFSTFQGDSGRKASFALDFLDSTGVYSLSLIVRLPKNSFPDTLSMGISFTAPSGVRGTETVSLPSDFNVLKRYIKDHPEDTRIRLASTPDFCDISWKYRERIRPSEYGTWIMDITIQDTGSDILGAGVTINKTTDTTANPN